VVQDAFRKHRVERAISKRSGEHVSLYEIRSRNFRQPIASDVDGLGNIQAGPFGIARLSPAVIEPVELLKPLPQPASRMRRRDAK